MNRDSLDRAALAGLVTYLVTVPVYLGLGEPVHGAVLSGFALGLVAFLVVTE